MDHFSTRTLDYLQRTGAALPQSSSAEDVTAATVANRRLLHVRRIGRERKRQDVRDHDKWLPPTAAMIAGLAGYRIPLAFVVEGGPGGVEIKLGTWSARRDDDGSIVERRLDVVDSVLHSLYPAVDVVPAGVAVERAPLAGLALGVPTIPPPCPHDPVGPWDRIARAMGAQPWAVVVLAHTVPEPALAENRHGLLNEMRIVQARAKEESAPSPLAEFYVELLRKSLKSLSDGAATGAWRTAAYLLGDADTYPRLASTWRSVFSGEDSVPEPVRVFDLAAAAQWAASWQLPDDSGRPGPGSFRRPYEFQSVLTSAQLAAYVHLPELELPGFAVDAVPGFDAVAPPLTADSPIGLGTVVHATKPTGLPYAVARDSLTKHALVAGITGGGKSTTIFQLLEQLDASGVPFLVVEPAKSEYRALLEHPNIGPKLQIFTLGDETTSPLRLNPLEVPAGVSVSEQIDVVRAVMAGSFGMWTPLPQILERCLHEIYADRGWDLASATNVRGARDQHHHRSAPTLSHLADKVGPVVARLGYEERIRGDMAASLLTRIESLRTGGKGRLLDVATSVPMELLLSRPTVIELDAMGDDDDKAFVMGLLLVRLVQHRRAAGQSSTLRHLLVIEEAHRLLTARGPCASQEEADPKGKVVEMFSNLLSEIRAYGQGVVIADQVPVRLAPDVMKNTALKIAHRTVAYDDREALAGAMAMTPEQSMALTTFGPGRAAVFGDGDDAPTIVQVADLKSRLFRSLPSNDRVRTHMAGWRRALGVEPLFDAGTACARSCGESSRECALARRMLNDRSVQRAVAKLLISATTEAGAPERLWWEVEDVVHARRPAGVDAAALLASVAGHGGEWFAERRGAKYGWTYETTDEVAAAAIDVLLAVARSHPSDALAEAARRFAAAYVSATRRTFDPYPSCSRVCPDGTCRFRHAVEELIGDGSWDASWKDADLADAAAQSKTTTWTLCQDAAFELVEWTDPTQSAEVRAVVAADACRGALCFAQQMIVRDHRNPPRGQRVGMERILAEAQR